MTQTIGIEAALLACYMYWSTEVGVPNGERVVCFSWADRVHRARYGCALHNGNLLKFAEGLAKIDVQNQVVLLFDNDAEGYDAYQRLSSTSLPSNMRGMILPELETFRTFPAKGPEGVHPADINRRAAAIECYLDLRLDGYPPAAVIWTNYKRELAMYHGALEHKDAYTKGFLKQTPEALASGRYDVSRIRTVLDAIVAECTAIAVDVASVSRP